MPPDGQPANFPQPEKPTEPVHPAHKDFQRVHDHSTMGVIAINADGLICYANAAALANTGLLKDELIGRPLFGIYHSASTDQDNEARILGMEEITDQEFTVKSDASAEQWALISSKVYRDAEGTVQTYLFIRDISALKKREKLFSYLNKAAQELAQARDTQSALDEISRLVVPTFTSWFTIDLLKEGKLDQVLLKHNDPGKIEWARLI